MKVTHKTKKTGALVVTCVLISTRGNAQDLVNDTAILDIISLVLLVNAICILLLALKTKEMVIQFRKSQKHKPSSDFDKYLIGLNSSQIDVFLKNMEKKTKRSFTDKTLLLVLFFLVFGLNTVSAQTPSGSGSLLGHTGIIITIILIGIPVTVGILLLIFKILNALKKYRNIQALAEVQQLKAYLANIRDEAL